MSLKDVQLDIYQGIMRWWRGLFLLWTQQNFKPNFKLLVLLAFFAIQRWCWFDRVCYVVGFPQYSGSAHIVPTQ